MTHEPAPADTPALPVPPVVGRLFLPGVSLIPAGVATEPDGGARRVIVWPAAGELDQPVSRRELPLLVLPDHAAPAGDGEVLVAVEGRDRLMARRLAELLDPEAAPLRLLHVTWLPGTAAAAVPDDGLDDPEQVDLLAYEGAREALVDAAAALRETGFVVHAHLRHDRHPASAIAAYLAARPVALVVLGLGRHGLGIGRDLWERHAAPILFVDARES